MSVERVFITSHIFIQKLPVVFVVRLAILILVRHFLLYGLDIVVHDMENRVSERDSLQRGKQVEHSFGSHFSFRIRLLHPKLDFFDAVESAHDLFDSFDDFVLVDAVLIRCEHSVFHLVCFGHIQ